MISLTRLNGQAFVLNADLIRTIEASPDTVITLVSGEHLVVSEGVHEVVARVIDYGRLLRRALAPDPCAGGHPDRGGGRLGRTGTAGD
jgi:flagellar protein FlbD